MSRAAWMLLLVACKGGEDTGGTDAPAGESLDPATVPLEGSCPMEQDFGGFVVRSSEAGSGAEGSVADGVVPSSVLEEIAAEGDCRVLRRNNPVCDPACEAGQTCDFDGRCLPYPANQDLGTVRISGLSSDVVMEPVFPGNTYFDTSLPTPPYSPGGVITLDMPGGTYGPVELHGVGVEPLSSLDALWTVERGADLVVRWDEPGTEVVRSEVLLSINIDQHGASPGTLRCAFVDDGEGTVPTGIIDVLVEAGVTGFPSGSLERRTADRAELSAGCLDLVISAPLSVDVDVEGYTPCVSDSDCPDGQDCNEALQVCE